MPQSGSILSCHDIIVSQMVFCNIILTELKLQALSITPWFNPGHGIISSRNYIHHVKLNIELAVDLKPTFVSGAKMNRLFHISLGAGEKDTFHRISHLPLIMQFLNVIAVLGCPLWCLEYNFTRNTKIYMHGLIILENLQKP